MPGQYKISQIASLFDLHPDTLRYYEEQGLLAPARGQNGYRSYTVQDICTLSIVRTLRRLEMPVEKIAGYMQSRSVATTLELLQEEQRLIDAQIAELRATQREVAQRRHSLAAAQGARAGRVQLLTLPPRKCYRLETPRLPEPQVDVELKRLEHGVPELQKLVGARQMGAIVDAAAVAQGDYSLFRAVLFLGEQFADSDSVLPGGLYGSVLYRGGYVGLRPALQMLSAAVAQQGYVVCGDPLELYHVDVHDSRDEAEYLTEVQLPVASTKNDMVKD